MARILFIVALPFLLTRSPAAAPASAASREYGGHYTAERLANARVNLAKYDWAKKLADAAVARARPWLERTDDDLWSTVPGQDLPRCIDVTLDTKTKGPKRVGCLGCGDKINAHGNYPYEPDFEKLPWKLACPSCGAVFPTNDFGRYYASGIDEHGLFWPAKADRSLLYNTGHPDPKDPLHAFGVDDGFGFIDATGHAHKFIGYYAWKFWQHLGHGLSALANAYVHSGDKRYAHKAAVLLDRIADVYPAMDWKPYASRGWYHSDGGSGLGKIEGRIWETGTAARFCDDYDKILSGTRQDDALFAFLKKQSERYQLPTPKGTREQFVSNVDDRILRTMLLIDAPASSQPAGPGRKTGVDARANTYLVDIFQVTGGADHLYSFHGPPGDIASTALALVAQNEGTYAGPTVPFKTEQGPVGYSWWYNVRRDASPAASFTLDWRARSGYRGVVDSDHLHVRFHSLTALNDVALADVDPPQNKAGNPRRLGYALLHRSGPPGLASTFVSIIEPYRATPFITFVTRLDAGSDDRVVLRLQLADGSLDHVLFSASGRPIRLDGAPALAGTLGFTRERNGQVTAAAAIRASALTYKDAHLATVPAFTGTVVKMNRQLDGRGWIEVDTALPIDGTLVGQAIMIANDNERDACYTIHGVTREGAHSRVDCGPVSFVRDFAGPAMKLRGHTVASDYSQGYLYDFDAGARFVIPTAAVFGR